MRNDVSNQVARLSPLTAEQVREISLNGAEAELLACITATVPPARPHPRSPYVRSRSPRTLLASVCVATMLLVAIALNESAQDPAPHRVQEVLNGFSLAAVRVAEAAPRYLVDLPGWKITNANQFSGQQGQLVFGNGSRELELTWFEPNAEEKRRIASLEAAGQGRTANVQGSHVTVFSEHNEHGQRFTAHWFTDDFALRAQGYASNPSEFTAILTALRAVGVEEWLNAMPVGVVRPDNKASVVDEMLSDIPVPPGMDLDQIRSEASVLDRYQLGAKVVGRVACGWITQWKEGRLSGDAVSAQLATEAMARARDWDILREMASQGGFSQVVWDFADAMLDNGLVPAGRATTLSEVDLSAAFDCEVHSTD